MINYKSTRGSKEFKTSAGAIIKGIAEDRGLMYLSRFRNCLSLSKNWSGNRIRMLHFRS